LTRHYIPFLFGAILLLYGCDKSAEGKPVARVGDVYLYEKDLKQGIPSGLSGLDSTKRASVFVKNWLAEQVVLHKAGLNLDINEDTYAKRLASYKNELIIYDFQNQLINQKLNKEISLEELKKYYDGAQDNFVQKDQVVRVSYAVFKNGTPDLRQFGKWMRSDDQKENLRNFAIDNAISHDVDAEQWIPMQALLDMLPFNKNTVNDLVKSKEYRYMKADEKEYFVRVHDFRDKGEITPFELVKDRIESTLLNKKKSDLLKNLREDLYREYSGTGELEIFEQNN